MKNLHGAILAVQKQAPKLQRDKINPHFRSSYLSLETLMEQVLPALNEEGLIWVTKPGYDAEFRPTLEYTLTHAESGETVGGRMLLEAVKKDPQGQGSAVTYARRYALMAVLGLVADEDDDGNAASAAPPKRRQPSTRKPAPSPPDSIAEHSIAKATVTKAGKLIKDKQVPKDRIELILTTVGASIDGGKLSDAIKGLTAEQGAKLLYLLEQYGD